MSLLTNFWRRKSVPRRPTARPRQFRFELLENRRMLTLLGISPTTPEFTYDSTGVVNYTAGTETFLLTANPLTFSNVTPPPHTVVAPRGLTVDIQIDHSGNLIAGTGTTTDLVVDGTVQPNGPSGPTDSGQLLTGEITAFGYAGTGTTTAFDMRFTVTGGLMASYFAGDDIGMTVSAENSETFTGSFNQNFIGGAKGTIGNIPLRATPTLVTSASETAAGLVGASQLGDSATLSGGNSITGGSITYTLTAPDSTTTTVGTVPVTGPGTYNAPTVTATEVGTYTWHATYSGDNKNVSVSDNGTNESVTTVKASPSIATTASETASGLVGTSTLSDSATISGGYNVSGGSVTFTLTAPDSTTTTVGTVPVSGTGTYNAPTVTATEVGTYVWHASYSGDGLNNGAIDNGANESLTTIAASPSIITSASESAGGVVGVALLSDSATISGGYNVSGGSITFTLTAPDSTTTTVGTVPVSGTGTYNAPNVTATQVGTYIWHASYSGDSLNNGEVDNGVNESLTTVAASPSVSTNASETAGGVVGLAQLGDSATISGSYNGTGSITFTLTAPNSTTTTVGTVAVSGNGTYSAPSVTATQVGTYVWHASYSGDSLNNGAVDNGTNESLTTVAASPSVSTSASETAGGVVGLAQLSDSATISGSYNGTGSITFTLTAPNSTTTTVGTVAVSGNGTYSAPSVTATQVGTYVWHASYSGDSLNNGAVDNGTNESLTTVAASPSVSTSASETAGGVVGLAQLSDSATISGSYNGTGSITFTLTAPNSTTTTVGTVAVSGNGTYSAPSVTATQVGTYVWHASYSGDSLNNGAVDNGTNESLTTVAASPSVSTSASETAGGVVGLAQLSDSATISGSYNGTGSITFTLTAPNSTTTTVGTVAVSGNGTYSAPSVTATQVGTYVWHASYSGDSLNNGAVDNGVNESLTTVAASPSVSTSASETAGGVVGLAQLSDSATISGSYNGTGSITFTLTAPNSTTTTVGTVAVSGNGTYSAPSVTATQVGTYVWHASYSGDSLNNGAVDNGVNESLTTVAASPSVSTSASETAGGVVGLAQLSDSATISGSYNGTGSITFTLTAPNSTTTTVGTVAVSGNGTYSAPSVTATQVGTYVWHASYSGDSLNNGAVDNGVNESLTTVKASPAVATSASETAGGVVGLAQLSDSATISGSYNGTGSITFTLTAPNSTTTTVGTVAVSGNGTYSAPSVTATQVGTYVWHASYTGDGLNNGAVDNGVNESLTTVKASPAVATSASETAGGVVGTSVLSDSATISGAYNGTGSITFTLTAPNSTTTTVGTVAVSGNGTYSAPSVTATQVGTYVWHASYTGDGLNNGAVDNGVNESLTTVKASPAVATSASETAGGVVGTSVLSDSATISGSYNGTGSITFTLTAPNSTTTTVGTVAVSGNGTYSAPSVTATQVGTYVWHASYSGDSLNNGAVDNGVNESLTTVKASPAVATSASETAGGVVGLAQLSDSATISGSYNGTGSITFTLTAPNSTTTTVGTVAVSGNGTYSAPSVTATQVGTYVWHASYTGDGLNNGAVDNGVNESLTTVKASPAVATSASETAGGVVGTSVLSDSATISGAYNGTGSITFTLTAPNSTTTTVGTVAVSGNGTYSAPSVTATQVGTYVWHASYTGDGLNNGAVDNGVNESLTTVKASPAVATSASETAGGVVGTSVLSDSATISGAYNGTGSITFTLTAPNSTTTTVGTVAVSGNGTYSAPSVTATQVGTYVWHASYTGDGLNNGAVDNGVNESLTTVKASPTIATNASETSSGLCGSSLLSDSATLAGGYNETGTITFTLTAPNNTTTTVGTVAVSGNGTYTSPSVTATQVGTYVWHATYNGDGLNNGAVDNGTNESLTTGKDSPTITTNASKTNSGLCGSSLLSDSATLSGGFNETGTITFTLTAPNNTTTTVGAVAVSGNGTYTSPSVTATQVGTYVWHATYSGDSLNNSAVDNGVNESLTTGKDSPTIATNASKTNSGLCGSSVLSDSATLSGGYNETGTITFTLTAPNNVTTTVGTVAVSGNGTYNSPNVTATQVGTYVWHATYSGDSLNNSAVDNGTNESLTTGKDSPTIATNATETNGGVCSTSVLNDTATLSGGYNETGSITFTLTAPNNVTTTVGTVTVSGNGTYTSPSVTATQVGTYVWHATYSGDSLNNSAVDNGTNESLTTGKDSPTIATNATETNGGVCNTSVLNDTATLSGGYNETGTITFTLTAPNNVTTTVGTVTVSGNGTYTSPSVTASQVGTYKWHATYSGDSLNNSAADNGTNESLTIIAQTGSISGTVYTDVTGNGLTPDDTVLAGVQVYIDVNNVGHYVAGDPVTTSAANGTYSFTGLAAGTYIVAETVPTNDVLTDPVLTSNYTITLSAGQNSTGNNFDNASSCGCGMSGVTNIVYVINGLTAVSDMRGNTAQGETIQVTFTIAAGTAPETLSLVSYTAPSATFVASQASQQQIFDDDSGTFGPGTYTLTVTIPYSYYQVDFVCGAAIDTFGPANSNIFYSAQNRLFSADNGGTQAMSSTGGSLTGFVYVDPNGNGTLLPTDAVVAGALINLSGTSTTGVSIKQSAMTNYNGMYEFDNLPAGTYSITETQAGNYSNGPDNVGSLGGSEKTNNVFSNIVLGTNVDGVNYNFGAVQTTGAAVAANQTATVAFWSSNSGQNLIKALNGSSNATALSSWLTTNYGNMYGSTAGTNNLTGKTNAQVASYYQSLASNLSQQLNAATLALALNVYVTTSSLAGNVATSYGFAVSTNGLGAATVNDGSAGAAFGLDDDILVTVSELLYLENQRAYNGVLWDYGGGAVTAADLILQAQAYTLIVSIDNT